MKKISLAILCCLPVMLFAAGPDKNNTVTNNDESTKVSLYIPGFLMKMGSLFVPREEEPELKVALKKLRSTSIIVREGCAYHEYNASNKYEKKMKTLDRQNFEEMVSVVTEEEKVSVQLRQNKKDKIRQVVVLVDDGECEFVFVRLRCNIGTDELKHWMEKDGVLSSKLGNKISI